MLTDLVYTGGGLDRAADARRDEDWVIGRLHARGTLVLPVWRNRNLVVPAADADGAPSALTITGPHARGLLQIASEVVLLGIDGDTTYFAADLSEHDAPDLTPIMGRGVFEDLRTMGALLAQSDASLLAYARGMLYWHRRNRFCGDCGSATRPRQGGHLRECTNGDCERQLFPDTNPAIIVLVTRPGPDGGACLLARQTRWPRGMYSTLAGFVDIGESLEEAVVREVAEEAGIRVAEVRYRGSQPWPFPSSLMVGFRAAAATVRLRFDAEELEDARWFTRGQIARFDDHGLRLPRADSIARALVEEWLAEADG